jgi:hypothetical protein
MTPMAVVVLVARERKSRRGVPSVFGAGTFLSGPAVIYSTAMNAPLPRYC